MGLDHCWPAAQHGAASIPDCSEAVHWTPAAYPWPEICDSMAAGRSRAGARVPNRVLDYKHALKKIQRKQWKF